MLGRLTGGQIFAQSKGRVAVSCLLLNPRRYYYKSLSMESEKTRRKRTLTVTIGLKGKSRLIEIIFQGLKTYIKTFCGPTYGFYIFTS